MLRLLTFMMVLLMPVLAFAQATDTSTASGMIDLAKDAWSAGQGGAWGLAVGLGIMALMKAATKFGLTKWIPDNGKRWAVLGMAVLASVGAGLAGGAGAADILLASVSAAMAAVASNEYLKALRPSA